VTWGTTDTFLDHFGLESLDSLPGVAELKAAGLIDSRPAITALGGRGHLLAPGEPGVDTEELAGVDGAEDEEELDDEFLLSVGFGEDLLDESPLDEDVAGEMAEVLKDDDGDADEPSDTGVGSDPEHTTRPEH
jgi:segregation and condensation protein B